MPRRTDIESVLLIGSGPIVIGQACEFDYSGTQGVKALREEGFRVILVNSNPATIMTDPELADRTYVEPLTIEIVTKIIERERPDALLPTLGGQTALNLTVELAKAGVLDKYGVKLIGAQVAAIEKAEDRELFKQAMSHIGLKVPLSGYAHTLAEARTIQAEMAAQLGTSYPVILRPSFTLGGSGAAIAWNAEEFETKVSWGLQQSPRGEVLVEQSVLGWKEYELEVMRDGKDNAVIVCSIENFDPMGVHTGDSITIAPAMTLTDKEYQVMRDAALAVIREIGVDTGGSNIQFAVNPKDGYMVVIEMNPRVSRSSALASKATGFPIAKIATKLAVGYTLDEIPNDITRETQACFEPTIDYVVTKVPRFAFEKFPGADATLGPQMKSVGEVMAIGRTFCESLGKALRSLEIGRWGLDLDRVPPLDELKRLIHEPGPERLWQLAEAMRAGLGIDEAHQLTAIDPWFLAHLEAMVKEDDLARSEGARLLDDPESLARRKRMGMSDRRLMKLAGVKEEDVRQARLRHNIRPVLKRVDTCAAEFEAHTPYLYSTYEHGQQQAIAQPVGQAIAQPGQDQAVEAMAESEARPTGKKKIVILGGGPNRIGQGIEFDYCCVHAVMALREDGYETIMVNCNPETVSTDYDTADRLYFEPLTREDVLEIIDAEKPEGVIVQFGGQTPLRLAVPLQKAGVKLLGTSADAIDRAEDRQRFGELVSKLGLRAPAWGTAHGLGEARAIAERIGYPVMVRPSYVLGGRAMEIVYELAGLETFVGRALEAALKESLASGGGRGDESAPILVDQFLKDAIEVDVDVVADGHDVVIGGVMEHIEEAGIHSGDSACALPTFSLPPATVNAIKEQSRALARELDVRGLMNVQFAVPRDGSGIFILEVNPRASRTVPFVSKVIGVPLAKIAAKVAAGRTLKELGVREVVPKHIAVKEAVFPFVKFGGVDILLGPEMRSTGEVMGIDRSFEAAFAKSQLAASMRLPVPGKLEGGKLNDKPMTAFMAVKDADKDLAIPVARTLVGLGFRIMATSGTHARLSAAGVRCERVNKVSEGRPHCVDRMLDGDVHLVVNTTAGGASIKDSFSLRRTALMRGLPYYTTMSAARAAADAIARLKAGSISVCSLQEYQHG